jgi:hypothetical protein
MMLATNALRLSGFWTGAAEKQDVDVSPGLPIKPSPSPWC